MAQCSSCSAPLPVNTCRCSYCGTRNDMDFAAVAKFTFDSQPSRRRCPDCSAQLQTVRLDTGGGIFAIDRCKQCYGLFFAVGEVQSFLQASVSPAFSLNLREIVNINDERARMTEPVRYKKCPECGILMNRVNYSAMSGVVVDQCKDHGMWLDNGELVHLMEWKKAGGQLLAEQKEKALQQERTRETNRPATSFTGTAFPAGHTTDDVVSTVCSFFLDTLFR